MIVALQQADTAGRCWRAAGFVLVLVADRLCLEDVITVVLRQLEIARRSGRALGACVAASAVQSSNR